MDEAEVLRILAGLDQGPDAVEEELAEARLMIVRAMEVLPRMMWFRFVLENEPGATMAEAQSRWDGATSREKQPYFDGALHVLRSERKIEGN